MGSLKHRVGLVAGAAILGSFLVFAGAAGAQQAAPAAPTPPEPAASTVAAARDLVVASGMARSFVPMVPDLLRQIVPTVTRTHPELSKDLDDVVTQLEPEFVRDGEQMVDIAARVYARHMSEDELNQTVTFFKSTAGIKYVAAQPLMLDELVVAMQSWTQQLSNIMMNRVREEMTKKGHSML